MIVWLFVHMRRNQSGLPFYEIMLLTVPASHSLPLAVVHAARQRILEKAWDFDYLFFTESDQILLWRPNSFDSVFSFLDKYPRRVMVPHRLIPYPSKVYINIIVLFFNDTWLCKLLYITSYECLRF